MTKELTQLQIDAAQMVAKGLTDVAIAESLGRSRRWVQSQKQLPEFVELVEEFTENYKQAIIEDNNENLQEILKNSRQRMRRTCEMLFSTCDILVEKLSIRLKDIDPEDLKVNQLPQALKQLTDCYKSAIDIETQSFGIDRIIKELENIRKVLDNS